MNPQKYDRAWALATYPKGVSVAHLSRSTGAAPSTIYKWLHDAGIPVRRPGPARVNEIPDETIIEMRDVQAQSWRYIGEALELSPTGAKRRYLAAKAKLEQQVQRQQQQGQKVAS